MVNGETSGWNRTKSAVVSWWHRSGWKTVAHVAVPLAIIFGAVAALQRIELHSHHLVIPTDPVGPNWAEIAMAVFTLILVFGAILALGAVRQARRAVREARRARNAVQMSELSRRWDEEPNREVRRQVRGFAESGQDGFVPVAPPGPQRLKEVVTRFRHDNAPEYRMLLTDPNFLEDVAIMIEEGGIDFEIVNRSLGYNIPYRWSLWQPTIDALRGESGEDKTYCEFQNLAERIAPKYPKSIKLDSNGEIEWTDFID